MTAVEQTQRTIEQIAQRLIMCYQPQRIILFGSISLESDSSRQAAR